MTTRVWARRPIADDYVYLWADGVYLDAGARGRRTPGHAGHHRRKHQWR